MRKFSFLILCLALLPAALPARNLGEVPVTGHRGVIAIQVSGATPELNGLARLAFATHGRYELVSGPGSFYQIRFSPAGPSAVTVRITRGPGHEPFASETVSGNGLRGALLRAADVAVAKTNGLGLRGYFTSKIAFVAGAGMRKDVYAGDLFFAAYRRLTADRADALFPSWSPDGTRLLYTSFRRGFPDIYVIDLRSLTLSTFESFRGTNLGARFSPDGRRVAMVLTGDSGNSQIWMSDAEGHGLRELTHFRSNKASPCWSPDGSRIVFASSPGPQLYLISAYGGSPRRLTLGISSYCAEPTWSRTDPDKIAFTVREGGRYQIAVISVSTGEARVVSHAPFDGIEPSWLPDGRHLVYTARDAYHSRLCILDTESGKSTPISPLSFGPAEQADVWSR
ncbi:MAG: biopolymer transporter Tol [Opitutaceae bacterium]